MSKAVAQYNIVAVVCIVPTACIWERNIVVSKALLGALCKKYPMPDLCYGLKNSTCLFLPYINLCTEWTNMFISTFLTTNTYSNFMNIDVTGDDQCKANVKNYWVRAD